MRATASVHSRSSKSGSGAFAMRVPGLARKFWMISSWMCPCASCAPRSASSESMRSSRVSPMPMRMPDVKGTASSPASRIVSRRAAGSLSGEPWCACPFSSSRGETLSSMMPCDTDTSRSRAMSAALITPGLRWGSSPVSAATASAASAR